MAETKKKLLRLGGQTFARLIRHVASSSKIIHEPPDLMDRLREYHPCIVACWHGQFMMVATLRPENVKIAAMVARHGDAEIISETLQAMDVQLIRGAGAGWRKRDRGGAAALRSSLQALADGASLVMTADVPPGPARVAGAGIITIARMSGRLIVPVALATKPLPNAHHQPSAIRHVEPAYDQPALFALGLRGRRSHRGSEQGGRRHARIEAPRA